MYIDRTTAIAFMEAATDSFCSYDCRLNRGVEPD